LCARKSEDGKIVLIRPLYARYGRESKRMLVKACVCKREEKRESGEET